MRRTVTSFRAAVGRVRLMRRGGEFITPGGRPQAGRADLGPVPACGDAMSDWADVVAQAIFAVDPNATTEDWAELTDEYDRNDYRRMAQAAIDALELAEEHQWVPVAESGHRWHPRDKGLAEAALDLYGTNGSLQVVEEHGDPLSHIEHESRLVSPWVRKDNTNE